MSLGALIFRKKTQSLNYALHLYKKNLTFIKIKLRVLTKYIARKKKLRKKESSLYNLLRPEFPFRSGVDTLSQAEI
jgi:hypothetical protein